MATTTQTQQWRCLLLLFLIVSIRYPATAGFLQSHQVHHFHHDGSSTYIKASTSSSSSVSSVSSRLRILQQARVKRTSSTTVEVAQAVVASTSSSCWSCWSCCVEEDDFLNDFCGDFDNYHQVCQDRLEGKLPREGGGHEHIHCTLIPISSHVRLAVFYFNADPNHQIFRIRLYQLSLCTTNTNTTSNTTTTTMNPKEDNNCFCMNMTLYTLHPTLEQQLRSTSNLQEWPRIYQSFLETTMTTQSTGNTGTTTTTSTTSTTSAVDVAGTKLQNCDVQWTQTPDPIQHSYLFPNDTTTTTTDDDIESIQGGFHAVMIHGNALVESTMVPAAAGGRGGGRGQLILIQDQLSLFPNEFYIHDRGLDPNTGQYIYGNQANIPYQLQRVTRRRIVSSSSSSPPTTTTTNNDDDDDKEQIIIVNPSLQWTLGPEYRTNEEYQDYMKAIQ